jgi:hypothetical protein
VTDSERLDWMDALSTRTEYQNKRVPRRHVSSDFHFDYNEANLYIRNQEGRCIACGRGTVREAIDMAATGLLNAERAHKELQEGSRG